MFEHHIIQSFVTDTSTDEGSYFYFKCLLNEIRESSVILERLVASNYTIKYSGLYLVDECPCRYKLQLMCKSVNTLKAIKENCLNILHSLNIAEIQPNLDKIVQFAGTDQGSSTDYPIYSYSKPADRKSRMILVGTLWEYIYQGFDHYFNNQEPTEFEFDETEFVFRNVGYQQGLRFADLVLKGYFKDTGKHLTNINQELFRELLPYFSGMLRSYSYGVLEADSIKWDEEKNLPSEMIISDSFFYRENRQAGFLQGLLTGYVSLLIKNVNDSNSLKWYYGEVVENRTKLTKYKDKCNKDDVYEIVSRKFSLVNDLFLNTLDLEAHYAGYKVK